MPILVNHHKRGFILSKFKFLVLCWLQYNVMVTAGANQALTSIMLTLLDPPDKAVLFRPYYFNALMALQMTG